MIDRVEKMRISGGSDRWMSITQVPIRDNAELVTGIVGISRDITKLKNVEEKLREKSEHHRLVIETANDAFISLDSAGLIVAWNRQAEITFGWTAREAVGRLLADTIIPPSGNQARLELFQYLANPNGRIEIDLLRRNGVRFSVELTAWAVLAGGAESLNVFVRDITERRTAQEALNKKNALVQLLQAVTVAANESSTIERAAHACLDRICRYTRWPLGHVWLLVHGPVSQLVSAKLWHAEENRRFTAFREATGNYRFAVGDGLPGKVLESGSPGWIVDIRASEYFTGQEAAGQAGLRSAFAFPILVKGKVMGVLEFFSLETAQPDPAFLKVVTHIGSQLGEVIIRQRAQEDLARARHLAESSNRAKSEFLNTISHEIRTPMNAILGMADLLSETSLTAEQQNHVRIFKRAGATLLHLINDLLDFSKVESGRCELELIDFNLLSVLESTTELMLSPARAKGLRLTSEVLPDVPVMLVGDPDRLRQILLNLIGNALKFTERGSIAVRVTRDLVAGEPGPIRFAVADTGIGIAPGKMEMIFGSFTQADSSTTRIYGGTGLGLAICKGLIELMGGQIGCTSELGKGSEFFFTVPLGTPARGNNPQPAIAPNGSQAGIGAPGTRILIVEDSEDNLALIKAYFKKSGFDLDVAANGKIAVEKVLSGNYDIVLMDIQMPVMDGHDATRAIRIWEQRQHSGPIPILALTAHASDRDAAKSREAGCVPRTLQNPIEKTVLLNAIAKVCDSQTPLTAKRYAGAEMHSSITCCQAILNCRVR